MDNSCIPDLDPSDPSVLPGYDWIICTVISRLHHAAAAAKIDAEANLFARLADRLANQGRPFEKPLTQSEVNILKRFL